MLNTARKIAIGGLLSNILLHSGVRPLQRVRRNGILFNLDLREGIDLSIFLFGSFQRRVGKLLRRFVTPGGVVIDVGANIGALALPMANHLTAGHLYAIEPTDFAFSRLVENLALNPSLAERITPVRTFFGDVTRPRSDMRAYSSWPLASTPHAHPVHKGILMPASCGQLALDDFVAQHDLQALSLIKIDTDGYEYEVVAGARKSITRFRPVVVFEACEYLMRPPRPTFENLSALFESVGYTVCGATMEPLTPEAFLHICPRGGGLDLVALPREHGHSPSDTLRERAEESDRRGMLERSRKCGTVSRLQSPLPGAGRQRFFALLAALPLLVDWFVKVFVIPRPFWIEHYDAEATYFLQSLRIATGHAPTYIGHPGTPVHLVGAAIELFTGRSPLAIEPMLIAGYVVSLLANLAAMVLLRRTLFRDVSPWLWVTGIWTYFLAPSALQYDTIWSAEIFFFSAGALALAAIWRVRENRSSVALAGAAIGFCVAIKFIFAAWLVGFVVMLVAETSDRVARVAIACTSAIAAFVLATSVAAPQYLTMLRWVWQLATHRGVYGYGPRGAPDVQEVVHNFAALAWIASVWLVWITVLAFYLRRTRAPRTTYFVLPAIACSLILGLRAPGADFHYFLPIALAAMIAVAELPPIAAREMRALIAIGTVLMVFVVAQDIRRQTHLVHDGIALREEIDAAVRRHAPGGIVLYTWRAPEPSFALQSMTDEKPILDVIASRYPREGHWAGWHRNIYLPPGAPRWDIIVLNERFVSWFPEALGPTVEVIPPFRITLRPGAVSASQRSRR